MVLERSQAVFAKVAWAPFEIPSTHDSVIMCHWVPAVPYCPYMLASGGSPSGEPSMDDCDCGGTNSPSAPLPADSGNGAGSPGQMGLAWAPLSGSTMNPDSRTNIIRKRRHRRPRPGCCVIHWLLRRGPYRARSGGRQTSRSHRPHAHPVRGHGPPACLYPILHGASSSGSVPGATRRVAVINPGTPVHARLHTGHFYMFPQVTGMKGSPKSP